MPQTKSAEIPAGAANRDFRIDPKPGDVFLVEGQKGKVKMANMYWVSGYHGPQSFGMSLCDFRKWTAGAELVRSAEAPDGR